MKTILTDTILEFGLLIVTIIGMLICLEGMSDPEAAFAHGAWGFGGFSVGLVWAAIQKKR